MTDRLNNLTKASLLSGETTWRSRAYPSAGIESVFFSDGPHGVRKQSGSGDHLGLNASEPATCFPTAATMANSWDVELAEEVGRALGVEAASLDVDVLLGPGLNIKRSPLAGRNFEYFSEDPYLAGKMAAAYIRGIQSQGVAATPKHFAVNSQETRRMASDSIVDERTLREIYLTGFEIAVKQGKPRALMSSYNLINGSYGHENRHLLIEILREEWGFDGLVVSDWGGSNDAVAAVSAGGTLEMPAPGLASVRQVMKGLDEGRISQADLDARAGEMIGLAEYAAVRESATFDVAAHHELARRAAEASIVLLRNLADTLPLAADVRIGLVGDMAQHPRYQGAGSSVINPTRLVSATEAFAAAGLNVIGLAPGYQRNSAPDAALKAEAVRLAARSDVVVVFAGLDEISESEGVDREHIGMPAAQTELIKALATTDAKVVVVLSAGSVVATDWLDDVDAVVHSYLGGQAGAEAVVRVLSGAVNPSGKLAETYPFALSDTPTAGRFPERGRYSYYREGPFVGYRHYDSAGIDVRFCFGHGLSYSTFEYGGLRVDQTGVSFDITNTSEVAGVEIAQLYVRLPGSNVVRPAKELKGFAKVELAPGQTRPVRIEFDEYTWRHFDVATGQWQTEQGQWEVLVGASAADIRLSARHEVSGVVVPAGGGLAKYRSGDIRQVTDADFAELLGRELPREQGLGARRIELHPNSPLLELRRARNPLARLAYRILDRARRRADAKGQPDLNTLFLFNMPFRAIGKMTGGMVSPEMVDGIVELVNGHGLRGSRAILGGFVANRRANKQTAARLR